MVQTGYTGARACGPNALAPPGKLELNLSTGKPGARNYGHLAQPSGLLAKQMMQ